MPGGQRSLGIPLALPSIRRGAPSASLLALPGLGVALPPTLPGHEQNCGDPAAAFSTVSQLGLHFPLEERGEVGWKNAARYFN